MPCNGHLRTKLPQRRKVKDNGPRPVREVDAGKHGGADGAHEQCRLAFPTKVAPMMRRCEPFDFGAMMERWGLLFS
jgi:hypothetical protein